ncbi:MAG: hypothetical protein A2W23_06685 [Planctomycetes bacterium RBG_16_43_13]|nr:MAG: hypothetical protein A2W23_06685 [Planctomycetes bacterium RBG_16_43_13]
MAKVIVTIVLILTATAAVFSTVRYNDVIKQNNELKNELSKIEETITNLQKRLGGQQKSLAHNDNTSDYYDLEEEKIARIFDERLSKAFAQNQGSIASPNLLNNQGSQPQPSVSTNFREEVRKAVQEVTEEFYRGRGRGREDRTISLLERELALNPAQKEQIQKLFDEQNKMTSDIWSKRREPGFNSDQARQDMQKIRQDTEARVKFLLDSSQLAKFDQLKTEGRLNSFSGGDNNRGRRPPRGQ